MSFVLKEEGKSYELDVRIISVTAVVTQLHFMCLQPNVSVVGNIVQLSKNKIRMYLQHFVYPFTNYKHLVLERWFGLLKHCVWRISPFLWPGLKIYQLLGSLVGNKFL